MRTSRSQDHQDRLLKVSPGCACNPRTCEHLVCRALHCLDAGVVVSSSTKLHSPGLSLAHWHQVKSHQRQVWVTCCALPWPCLCAQVSWWRSQSVRFFLRWPSAYLCHLTNIARHHAYGAEAAAGVARALAEQAEMRDRIEKRLGSAGPWEERGPGGRKVGFQFAADAGIFQEGSAQAEAERGQGAGERESGVAEEMYVPRPLVSIHVRQGDKGKEMRLHSFDAFMWAASRLRLLVPDLKNVWLSTEMQVGPAQRAVESICTLFMATVQQYWLHACSLTEKF